MNLGEALDKWMPEGQDEPRIDLALEAAMAATVPYVDTMNHLERAAATELLTVGFAHWMVTTLVQYGETLFGWDEETAENAARGMGASFELIRYASVAEVLEMRNKGAGSNGQRKPGQGT